MTTPPQPPPTRLASNTPNPQPPLPRRTAHRPSPQNLPPYQPYPPLRPRRHADRTVLPRQLTPDPNPSPRPKTTPPSHLPILPPRRILERIARPHPHQSHHDARDLPTERDVGAGVGEGVGEASQGRRGGVARACAGGHGGCLWQV